MLEGLTLIDCTSRLPGPLAAALLLKKGARVIKVESRSHPDPFNCEDPLFSAWYREINQGKEIQVIDTTQTGGLKSFQSLLSQAHVVLAGPKGALWDEVIKSEIPVKVILKATRPESEIKLLHDLNILAMKGVLTLHARTSSERVIAPPFLPVGGIAFASALALDIACALYRWQQTGKHQTVHTTLEEAVEELLATLCPRELTSGERTHFLHNGSYPCYNIYRTKDAHAVAFAPIESKLWVRFCELFNCSIPSAKRMTSYEEDPTLIENVASLFAKLTFDEVKARLDAATDGKDLCITPFKL